MRAVFEMKHKCLIWRKCAVVFAAASLLAASCASGKGGADTNESLKNELEAIIKGKPGQFGIAVITDGGDTLTVNDSPDYPLMSMFKLHEALAVCHRLDSDGRGLDSVISVDRADLDPHTWSPMLKDHSEPELKMTVAELLDYLLIHSDNNASNLLFDRIASVAETDSFVRSFSPGRFRLVYREADMQADHDKSYDNRTSPLAYAALVNRAFTDSVVSREKQEFVKRAMRDCDTGMRRLAAPLAGKKGVSFAHRTGSGYINSRGEVVAVNDGGYVRLPSGRCYSIAVLVKDYAGPQEEAEDVMAEISAAVFRHLSGR